MFEKEVWVNKEALGDIVVIIGVLLLAVSNESVPMTKCVCPLLQYRRFHVVPFGMLKASSFLLSFHTQVN